MVVNVQHMSGAGNLFTTLDNRAYGLTPLVISEHAETLCLQLTLLGRPTEGVIAINEAKGYNFEAWFFNPDGSSGMMCGNGSRCAVAFANKLGMINNPDEIKFKMAGNEYFAKIEPDGNVTVDFPPPIEIRRNIGVNVAGRFFLGDYINVGSDHFVMEPVEIVSSLRMFHQLNIDQFAVVIRNATELFPRGVNVNFIWPEKGKLYVRTYERGVEGETGACGTGAIASAISHYMKKRIAPPITLVPKSGDELTVSFVAVGEDFSELKLSGPAEFLEEKEIIL
ncbi:MAG: diaminopimelate epimerase [Chloroflexota bacterium]